MRTGAAVRAGVFGLAAAACLGLVQSSGQASTGGSAFTSFELASTPPSPAGTVCPGSGSACTNIAAEPAIRADPAGTFHASSENGLGAGTVSWRSTDGGRSYATVQSPDGGSSANTTGLAPGGGDVDEAVAPVKNAQGNYNVYVASLTLANIDVSTSTDGGRTFTLNPVAATSTGDDREWVAADGANKVCLSYHDGPQNIEVNCGSVVSGTYASTSLGSAIDSNHAFLVANNEIGNLAIDPASHTVYQVFSGIDNAGEATGAGFHDVWLGVSTDGGQTFTDKLVYRNPSSSVDYGHQFVNVSLDKAGNVYAVYSDNHNLFYSYSTDRGATFSPPVQVNSAPSATAIEPWSVAGDAGKLDVVWYGTSFYDGTTVPDNYPDTAQWYVYFAQNTAATTAGSSFTQEAATPVIHLGGVCEGGIGCTGNRDLFDDFGVAASPTTGFASIVYSDDQFSTDPSSPPPSGCTAANNNSISCDQTSIATQTAGVPIFTPTTTAGSGGMPNQDVPEAPWAAALPLAGLGVAAGLLALAGRRRRRA